MSRGARPHLPSVLPLLYAAAPDDVQFACPWCSTMLSLPSNDFRTERAVLCPRCNNPVDLEVQRRLQQSAPRSGKAPGTPLPSIREAHRREVTTARKREPPRKDQGAPDPAAPHAPWGPPGGVDLSKPLDVDAYFGTSRQRTSAMDHLMGGQDPSRQPGAQPVEPPGAPGAGAPAIGGGKVKCPGCGFDNSTGYDPFRVGVAKCAWCAKPLPV